MAEIVEYRLEKGLEELNLLVELKLFTRDQVKEVLAKREAFEYALRKRTRSKLDFLKYIRYEVNFLESLDGYKKTVLTECRQAKRTKGKLEDLERRILVLKAKKLNDVIRGRCAHIASLFRKLTTSFQFDKSLWLAYIDFTRSRNFNTRTTALYWRLLRVASGEPEIWLAAARHETHVNQAYDTARGLYLRALRHHPSCHKLWAEYFSMELRYLDVVQQRASIIITGKPRNTDKSKPAERDPDASDDEIWKAVEPDAEAEAEPEDTDQESKREPLPRVKVVDEEEDKIMLGHLAKVVFDTAMETLSHPELLEFFKLIVAAIIELPTTSNSKGLESVKEHILSKVNEDSCAHLPAELIKCCFDKSRLDNYLAAIESSEANAKSPAKRIKRTGSKSKMDILYEQYESSGLEAARKKFAELERVATNKKLSLYVGMIQIELWQLEKDKSRDQLNRIRSVYDKALVNFAKTKPKLWYEYIKFEFDHAKTLDDFERVNQLYGRAQVNLHPSKVDKVVEKYTAFQNRDNNSADIEYSDYSDLDD